MASHTPLLDAGGASGEKRSWKGSQKVVHAFLAGMGVAGVACGFLSMPISSPSSIAPTSLRASSAGLWTPDQPGLWENQAFETMLEFHIPYMSFKEQVYVHLDAPNGLQRLSYYNGADVYLVNTTGRSYELVPVAEYESCLVTSSVNRVEMTVPELDLFRRLGSHKQITLKDDNGNDLVGYEFVLELTSPHVSNNSHWTYGVPINNFVGKYVFQVDATHGGVPVRMSFNGHNPFLIGSHQDQYEIVYTSFYPRPEGIHRSFFNPPQGMTCTPYSNPTGPFKTGGLAHRHPVHDFAMAMPGRRGDNHREAALREVQTNFAKECSGFTDCQDRQHLALAHFRWIQAQNRQSKRFKLGVNHMLDWNAEERFRVLGRAQTQLDAKLDLCGQWAPDYDTLPALPAELDLRDKGLVGPPRDQGTCGSCWAFGTIGMIEGQMAKRNGLITRMSEQHLLDCSWAFGPHACDGGNDYAGLSWILAKNGGEFPTADSYGTYLSQNGFCHFDASKGLFGLDQVAAPPPGAKKQIEVGAVIKSCWHVPGPEVGGLKPAEARLEHALASIGPLSISLAASAQTLYYYESGVYDDPACGNTVADLDHTVLLTGYGTSSWGETYWWLRNSWSTNWGEEGFIRVAQRNNLCGIALQGNFALLA